MNFVLMNIQANMQYSTCSELCTQNVIYCLAFLYKPECYMQGTWRFKLNSQVADQYIAHA